MLETRPARVLRQENEAEPEMTSVAANDLLPLTPVVFHTLLTLVDGASHGYAIARTVEERTDNRVRMGPGTLYGSLSRMTGMGLIEECGDSGNGERRRNYRLTDLGRDVLEREARRLEGEVEILRSKKVLS